MVPHFERVSNKEMFASSNKPRFHNLNKHVIAVCKGKRKLKMAVPRKRTSASKKRARYIPSNQYLEVKKTLHVLKIVLYCSQYKISFEQEVYFTKTNLSIEV